MIKFKDITNEQMGVIFEEEDFYIRAPYRYTETSVDGRHGTDITLDAFDNVEGEVDITLLNDNVHEVINWLTGQGTFEFNDKKTTMYFLEQVDYKRLSCVKNASISYIRSPFWYVTDDEYAKIVSGTLCNFGNFNAYPMIKLTKNVNSEVSVKINDIEFTYNFETESEVTIDCLNKQEVDENGTSKSRNITIGYEYPFLLPGDNEIVITGDCNVEILRKDCWL